jgi:hypothetical protein
VTKNSDKKIIELKNQLSVRSKELDSIPYLLAKLNEAFVLLTQAECYLSLTADRILG